MTEHGRGDVNGPESGPTDAGPDARTVCNDEYRAFRRALATVATLVPVPMVGRHEDEPVLPPARGPAT